MHLSIDKNLRPSFRYEPHLLSFYQVWNEVLYCTGRLIYHGPIRDVEHFFIGTGFRCPPRTDVPDFLQEVTSRKDQVWPAPMLDVSTCLLPFGGGFITLACDSLTSAPTQALIPACSFLSLVGVAHAFRTASCALWEVYPPSNCWFLQPCP